MHGQVATIKDIVLEERPEVVDLHCNEQLLDSSESEEEDSVREQLVQQAQQAYRVVTTCGICKCPVRLVVQCGDADLKVLQELLLGELSIVCPGCA
uniref:Protein E7 n=1 Tax=Human papillomavirus type 61 TaxID=37116 RepID=A0A0P0F1J9_HPV61|nr:early protein E7 [Human papillomavirus type 61]ALJ32785.1 early protein E7 [Human papillomavirus type 61]